MLESTSTADYDVIILTETWLDSSFNNLEFIDDQYEVFRKDRSESDVAATRGGGVLIAVKRNRNLVCDEFKFDEARSLEAVCVKLSRNESRMFIYAAYVQSRHVDHSLVEFYRAHLRSIEALNVAADTKDTVMVFGDFNFGNKVTWIENDIGFDYIPVLGESNERKSVIARNFTTSMMENGFFQMTSCQNSSGNVLDLIYTNSPELTVVSKADFLLIPSHKSDVCHVPLMCTIDFAPIVTADRGADLNDEVYSFRKANYDDIRAHLSSINIEMILRNHLNDVDKMVDEFYGILRNTFETFIPRTKIRSSNKPEWYDKELSVLKNRRNKEYKRLCEARLTEESPNERPFLDSKSAFEQHRSDLHDEFIRQQARNLFGKPKEFWRHLNGKRKTTGLPDVMHFDGTTATSDEEKASLFADYFEKVYAKHDEDATLGSFIADRDDASSHEISIDSCHVMSVLRRMDVNKGSGFDGVASLFLRECAAELADPLAVLFSTSLHHAYYPAAFKIGQLTPIYKSGARKDMNNYRGVNSMPNVAKVFDKVIRDQLRLITNPRISTSQHGFVSGRNIETNLLEHTTRIHQAFSCHSQLDVFYSDVSKAFDHVDESLQIRKLARFPLSNRSLLWFRSYLSDRQQYVQVGRARSRRLLVTSGTGQGSVNGPSLFIVFFDDSDPLMYEIVSLNFADDKKLSKRIDCVEDAMKLQEGIDWFMNWCKENKLQVNRDKCKVMTFTRKRDPIVFNYTIDGEPIKRVEENVDLGVTFDKALTFRSHYEYMTKRANATSKFVKRQSRFFGKETIKIIYQLLVRSILEFSALIWSPNYMVHRKSIESVQKQMVLFLLDDADPHVRYEETGSYALTPYSDRCTDLGITTLVRRRVNAIVLFVHSIITGRYRSPCLRAMMVLNDGTRILRNPNFIKLRTHDDSPFNVACRLFNIAAVNIDPTLTHNRFRTELLKLPDDLFDEWTKV